MLRGLTALTLQALLFVASYTANSLFTDRVHVLIGGLAIISGLPPVPVSTHGGAAKSHPDVSARVPDS